MPVVLTSHRVTVLTYVPDYYRVKLIVTVTRTGMGTPFSIVGRYSH
jgi:hypothetical protein